MNTISGGGGGWCGGALGKRGLVTEALYDSGSLVLSIPLPEPRQGRNESVHTYIHPYN